MIFQNAWFYAPLFFVLLSFKKRVMAHSLASFLKDSRAEKKKQKTCILKDHGYIIWIAYSIMRKFNIQPIIIYPHHLVKKLLSLLLLISLPLSSFAIQQVNKQWSVFTLSGNYKKLLYTIEPQLRLFDRQHLFQQFLANGGVGYKVNPNWQVWFGQTISVDSQDAVPGSVEEYRVWEQILYKQSLYSAQLISRTRLEERKSFFFPDWAYRFRERLLINQPIANNLSLVISNEIFINVNQARWIITDRLDQNRAYIGLEQRMSPLSYLGVGYMSQYLSLPTPQVDRVLVLSWRLDLEKPS